MSEGQNIDTRYVQLKTAVLEAKKLGIKDRAQRREAVIDAASAQKKQILPIDKEEAASFPSVGRTDLRTESAETINTAINKYLEIKSGDPQMPVIVDAIHASAPTVGEIYSALNAAGEKVTIEEVASSLRRIESKQESEELDEKVRQIRNLNFDGYTGTIASSIAESTNATLIKSKKSRISADLNRYWWKRDDRILEDEQNSKVNPGEYSRSARAAFYWATRSILREQGRLDSDEKLQAPFARISIHGMRDQENFDIAIAGSREPANTEFISWFRDTLQNAVHESGLSVNVVIALKEDPETKPYSGAASLRTLRVEPKEASSVQHPAFGDLFNTIQVEISNRLRITKDNRARVASALSQVISQIPAHFSNFY